MPKTQVKKVVIVLNSFGHLDDDQQDRNTLGANQRALCPHLSPHSIVLGKPNFHLRESPELSAWQFWAPVGGTAGLKDSCVKTREPLSFLSPRLLPGELEFPAPRVHRAFHIVVLGTWRTNRRIEKLWVKTSGPYLSISPRYRPGEPESLAPGSPSSLAHSSFGHQKDDQQDLKTFRQNQRVYFLISPLYRPGELVSSDQNPSNLPHSSFGHVGCYDVFGGSLAFYFKLRSAEAFHRFVRSPHDACIVRRPAHWTPGESPVLWLYCCILAREHIWKSSKYSGCCERGHSTI